MSNPLSARARLARLAVPLALLPVPLALPSFASADADFGPGTSLKPLKTTSAQSGGGATTQAAEPANGTLFCSERYTPVAAKPSGFAVGNCTYGTHVHRMKKSETQTGTYDGGKIFGRFAGCGWIRNDQRNGINWTDQWNECDPNSIGYNDTEFIATIAGGPEGLWFDGCRVNNPGDPECKGTPVQNRQACIVVANMRPWLSGQTVIADDVVKETSGAYRVIPANATYAGAWRFAWRYAAKYTTTDGTRWIMGRDRQAGDGDGKWVFVPLSCL